MVSTGATIVYLIGRIDLLQKEISDHYRRIDRFTRELGLLNNLLQELRAYDPYDQQIPVGLDPTIKVRPRPTTPHPLFNESSLRKTETR